MNTSHDLSINDLASIKVIIDTACTRGAFRANEMKSVGEVYDRLTAFLEQIVAQAEAESKTQGEQ